MRVNTRKALNAWNEGRSAHPAQAIHTDGVSIYSYGTCIVTLHNNLVIVNMTKYSRTTTVHQNALAAVLPRGLAGKIEVDGLPIGASPDALVRAAAFELPPEPAFAPVLAEVTHDQLADR